MEQTRKPCRPVNHQYVARKGIGGGDRKAIDFGDRVSGRMQVEIYTGVDTCRRNIWAGLLDHLPRVGEDIVLQRGSDDWADYRIDRIKHYLPTGKRGAGRVEIYVR